MIDQQTIELGIRIYESDSQSTIKKKIELTKKYKIRHFQIENPCFERSEAIEEILSNNLKGRYELSVYIDISENAETTNIINSNVKHENHLIIKEIIELAHRMNANHLALSPDSLYKFYKTNYSTGSLCRDEIDDFIDYVDKICGEHNIYLCIENGFYEVGNLTQEKFLKQVLKNKGANWIKLLLNYSNLKKNKIESREFLNKYNLHVAMVSWGTKKSALDKKNYFSDLDLLVNQLYYLPFKQRPLLFVDRKIENLERIFDHFYKFVLFGGFIYL